jgi:hypothetical protein
MRQLLIIFLAFLLPIFGVSQQFNFKRITTSSIHNLQKGQNAKKVIYDHPIGVSDDYFPNRRQFRLAQPICYATEDRTFHFETSYYFSKQDSVVRLIEYQWEGSESTSDAKFNLRVEQNKKLISKLFKQPGKSTAATKTRAAKTVWENNLVYVEQFYIPAMMRIRVLVSWK